MSFEEGVYTLDDGRIQVRFRFQHGDIAYQDALVFPQGEYAALTELELQSMKLDRFNNWVLAYETALNAPPEETPSEIPPE